MPASAATTVAYVGGLAKGIGVYNVVQKEAKAFANGLQKEEGGGVGGREVEKNIEKK